MTDLVITNQEIGIIKGAREVLIKVTRRCAIANGGLDNWKGGLVYARTSDASNSLFDVLNCIQAYLVHHSSLLSITTVEGTLCGYPHF